MTPDYEGTSPAQQGKSPTGTERERRMDPGDWGEIVVAGGVRDESKFPLASAAKIWESAPHFQLALVIHRGVSFPQNL